MQNPPELPSGINSSGSSQAMSHGLRKSPIRSQGLTALSQHLGTPGHLNQVDCHRRVDHLTINEGATPGIARWHEFWKCQKVPGTNMSMLAWTHPRDTKQHALQNAWKSKAESRPCCRILLICRQFSQGSNTARGSINPWVKDPPTFQSLEKWKASFLWMNLPGIEMIPWTKQQEKLEILPWSQLKALPSMIWWHPCGCPNWTLDITTHLVQIMQRASSKPKWRDNHLQTAVEVSQCYFVPWG